MPEAGTVTRDARAGSERGRTPAKAAAAAARAAAMAETGRPAACGPAATVARVAAAGAESGEAGAVVTADEGGAGGAGGRAGAATRGPRRWRLARRPGWPPRGAGASAAAASEASPPLPRRAAGGAFTRPFGPEAATVSARAASEAGGAPGGAASEPGCAFRAELAGGLWPAAAARGREALRMASMAESSDSCTARGVAASCPATRCAPLSGSAPWGRA
jgi:hypothetical protein